MVRDRTEYLSDIIPIRHQKLTNLTEYLSRTDLGKKRLYNYNPTLFMHKGKMYKVYRVSNFTYCSPREYLYNVQPTVNYIYIESPNKNIVHIDYLKHKRYPSCSEPYEDPRAIVMENQLLLICNNPQIYKCKRKMVVLLINLETADLDNNKKIQPDKIIPLTYDNANPMKVEKNWVPFVSNHTLHFLYQINPQIVLTCDLKTGICKKIIETHYHHLPTNIRGGTPAVLHKDQYYLAAGHALQKIMFKKIYFTFFYAFQTAFPFHIIGISKPFFMDKAHRGVLDSNIQYASGLEIVNDIVHLTYGYNDCDSRMLTFHIKDLENILHKTEK